MAFEDESIYAVIGIPVIFVLGLVGSFLPSMVAKFFPKYGITKRYYFSFFNGFAAGIILAVGLIHSLPEAVEGFETALTSDSTTDSYPWAFFVAMMAILILFTAEEILDVVANRFGIVGFDSHDHGPTKDHVHGHSHAHAHEAHACDHTPAEHEENDGECDAQPLEELCDHGHEDDAIDASICSSEEESKQADSDIEEGTKQPEKVQSEDNEPEPTFKPPTRLELLLKMIILFVGLMFHNIFVGLTLGIADNDYVLFIAIIFHQFFEGLGMGARVAMANLRSIWVVLAIDFIFATIPVVFIGVGIGIKNGVEAAEDTEGYSVTKGVFQALSAGVLIYVAAVHMFKAYRDNGSEAKNIDIHRVASYIGLILGAAVMAVIGIWA